jgi:hypothetical protein
VKDLARTVASAAKVYFRSALDPSQAQDDYDVRIVRMDRIETEALLGKAARVSAASARVV